MFAVRAPMPLMTSRAANKDSAHSSFATDTTSLQTLLTTQNSLVH